MKNLTEILKGVLVAIAIIALIVWTTTMIKKPGFSTTKETEHLTDSIKEPPVVKAGKTVATIGPCKMYELTLDNNAKIYVNICDTKEGVTSQSMVYRPY